MRKLKLWLTGLVLAMSVTVSACGSTEAKTEITAAETTAGSTEVQTEETRLEEVEIQAVETEETTTEHLIESQYSKENSDSSTVQFDLSAVPAYSGQAYISVNDNIPFFVDEEITMESFESYSPLDSMGRCGVAYASVGQELMPTEDRGSIGQVKPTGWHTVKYDNVDGKYLYNRCHLIGYQLTAENANEENLITGTRYLK